MCYPITPISSFRQLGFPKTVFSLASVIHGECPPSGCCQGAQGEWIAGCYVTWILTAVPFHGRSESLGLMQWKWGLLLATQHAFLWKLGGHTWKRVFFHHGSTLNIQWEALKPPVPESHPRDFIELARDSLATERFKSFPGDSNCWAHQTWL